MSIKQLSVFVENKAGGLAEITSVLARCKVDIRALSIADTTDYGILRLIVDKPEEAMARMMEEHTAVNLIDVIAVCMPDVPGALNEIVQVLSAAGIGIEYVYAFLSSIPNQATLVLRVANTAEAERVLERNGYRLLQEVR